MELLHRARGQRDGPLRRRGRVGQVASADGWPVGTMTAAPRAWSRAQAVLVRQVTSLQVRLMRVTARRVLRGCISKLFTPSLAFARKLQARLPVVPPLGRSFFRRGRFHVMLRTGGLHPPEEGLTPRCAAQVSPYVGGLLQGCLGTSLGWTLTSKSR